MRQGARTRTRFPKLEERRVAHRRCAHLTGLAIDNLGAIAAERGDWESRAGISWNRCGAFSRPATSTALRLRKTTSGAPALDHGNFVLAADLLQEAVSSARQSADPDLLAMATMNVAEALGGIGELARAEAMARVALAHFTSTGNGWRRVECERLLGDLEKKADHDAVAREWWSSALATARAIGAQLEVRKLEKRLDAE